jgi:Uncharacterised ArCR, COG2043
MSNNNPSTLQPDASIITARLELDIPVIGFYDSPDIEPFKPIVEPVGRNRNCIFSFYDRWLEGQTLHLTKQKYGCGGAGHWICGIPGRTREEYLDFLVNTEGLKSSFEIMNKWLDAATPYRQEHENILIGPLKPEQYAYLKTVTFFVNPDQLSGLAIGTEYNRSPEDPPGISAPFGSGCSHLIGQFKDITVSSAIIGMTDIAARKYIPENLLAFTVTKPLFEQLCSLGERSFLYKAFWKELKQRRRKKSEA